jgi:hypothetical protein
MACNQCSEKSAMAAIERSGIGQIPLKVKSSRSQIVLSARRNRNCELIKPANDSERHRL